MRTKKITYNPKNVARGKAQELYGTDSKIRESKVVTKETPKKKVVKTVTYGPMSYYGTQTKTKTKVKTKK